MSDPLHENTHAEKPRTIGKFDRLLLAPACVHYDMLATCPEGDLSMLRKLAALQWLSALWACVLIASAFKIITSMSGEWEPYHIALAILVTAIVVIADACIFIAAAHHAHGIARLEQTGEFKAQRTTGAKVRTGVLIAGRFAMALVWVNFLAVIAGLLAFGKDISGVLTAEYHRANSIISAQSAERFENELKRVGVQIAVTGALIGDGQKEQRRLRVIVVEPTADEPELRIAMERLVRAEAEKAEADRALAEAEAASADEVDGTCRRNRSCRAGRGPKWRAQQERITAARRRQGEASQTVALAQARLRELQTSRAGEMHRKTEDAKLRLAEVSAETQAQEARMASLSAEYQTRLSNRERLIRQAVESDPRYVPQNDGLVARLRALRELMQQPSVAALIFLIEGVLIFLELAAVIGVTIHMVPMAYALKIAERDVVLAHDTAKRLSKTLGRNEPSQPLAQQTTQHASAPSIVPPRAASAQPVTPPPVAPKANGSAPPGSGSSNPTPKPRHARWQPPSGSSGTAIPPEDEPPAPPNPNGKPPPSAPPT